MLLDETGKLVITGGIADKAIGHAALPRSCRLVPRDDLFREGDSVRTPSSFSIHPSTLVDSSWLRMDATTVLYALSTLAQTCAALAARRRARPLSPAIDSDTPRDSIT